MNITNLTLLANYLNTLPDNYAHFDMSLYLTDTDEDNTSELGISEIAYYKPTNCGTSACAVGHAPYVPGMPQPNDADYGWSDYSERIFELESYDKAWDWCFSAAWDDIDNTPKGAAARIRYLIQHPDLKNWESCCDNRCDIEALKLYNIATKD